MATVDEISLNTEVARYISRGYAVEHRTPGQVILAKQDRIGWFWNSVLTLITGGLWLIYVVYKLVNRKHQRVTITVQPNGVITRT